MSIYGSYEDMRYWQKLEAGQIEYGEPQSHVFIPGEDFDPYDQDDVEAVKLVMEKDAASQADYWKERALAAEARLADADEDDED